MLSHTLRQVSDAVDAILPPDRRAPRAFYPAIARSAVCVLAVPARSFAKLRSDRNPDQAPGSSFRADSLQSICRIFGGRTCVMFARSSEARTQELRRLCRLFADRTQEGDKQTALGRTW